jgi:hypothetical protein
VRTFFGAKGSMSLAVAAEESRILDRLCWSIRKLSRLLNDGRLLPVSLGGAAAGQSRPMRTAVGKLTLVRGSSVRISRVCTYPAFPSVVHSWRGNTKLLCGFSPPASSWCRKLRSLAISLEARCTSWHCPAICSVVVRSSCYCAVLGDPLKRASKHEMRSSLRSNSSLNVDSLPSASDLL